MNFTHSGSHDLYYDLRIGLRGAAPLLSWRPNARNVPSRFYSGLTSFSMNSIDTSYRVLYAKSGNKKRKTYQDGELLITSGSITLVDDQRKEIYRKKCYLPSVRSGEEITLGLFVVQIEDAVDSAEAAPASTLSRTEALGYVNHSLNRNLPTQVDCAERKVGKLVSSTISPPVKKKFMATKFVSSGVLPSYDIPQTGRTVAAFSEMSRTSFTLPNASSVVTSSKAIESISSSTSNSSSFVGSNTKSATATDACEVTLDTALIRVMRPHQIEAANFLIRRLLGGSSRKEDQKSEAVTKDATKVNHKGSASEGGHNSKLKSMVDSEDEDSGEDSLCDSDEECFEVKPPRYVEDAQAAEDPEPLSSYTGAILADEVLY